MSAPTEADIRAAVEYRDNHWPNDRPSEKLHEAVGMFFDPINYRTVADPITDEIYATGEYVWTDLRPSEEARLRELVALHRTRAEHRVSTAIVEEIVAAGMTFATEYPDAKRATREIEVA